MIRYAELQDLKPIEAFDIFAGDRACEIAERCCLVFEEGKQIVGYVSWVPKGFVGNNFISYLNVAQSARRKSVATELIVAVENQLAPCKLFISTESDNEPMIHLLEANGWTYSGTIDDANKSGIGEKFYRKLV